MLSKLLTKRFILTTLAAFVVTFILDFVVHGVLLKPTYEATAQLWRSQEEMQQMCTYMWISQLLVSIMFVFIFSQHYQKKGVAEGVRYGTYIGLLLGTLQIGTYAYMPIPFILMVSWAVSFVVWGVITGAVVAAVYRKF